MGLALYCFYSAKSTKLLSLQLLPGNFLNSEAPASSGETAGESYPEQQSTNGFSLEQLCMRGIIPLHFITFTGHISLHSTTKCKKRD